MNIFEAVNPVGIKQLLAEIHSGATVLPDFQRDFVWDPAATQGLLVSIANLYPAGSLLRARDTHRGFATRPFEGAPDENVVHTFLVLDGQQRLTSLYQSMFGTGKYLFFINLRVAFNHFHLDDDDTLFFRRANAKGVAAMGTDVAVQARDLVLPLSVFRAREGGYWKWVSDIRERLPEDARAEFEANSRRLYDSCLKHFEEYQFPTVTLTGDVPIEALCTIFETLNKTGVKLTVFELMVARFFKYSINIRTMWERAREKNPILSAYDVDEYVLVQAVSLMVTGSCQKKDVLNLTKKQLEENWDKAIKGLVVGLQMLRDDCKVMNRKWLPTPSMLGPLAAICAISTESAPKGAAIGARKAQIVRWLWCAMFGQRYEAAANTRAEKDVKDMREWFAGGAVPEMVEQFRFEKELLREVSTRAGAVYKSVICLILASEPHARDFHSGKLIAQAMFDAGDVEDHHVFPSAYLENTKGITKKTLRDCILNRTLIDGKTNVVISDRPPSEYLRDIDAHVDTEAVLKSHLLPTGPKSPLRTDDYEEFLNQRAELIEAAIAVVTS